MIYIDRQPVREDKWGSNTVTVNTVMASMALVLNCDIVVDWRS